MTDSVPSRLPTGFNFNPVIPLALDGTCSITFMRASAMADNARCAAELRILGEPAYEAGDLQGL
jgi:hypothetical protein